MAKRVKTYAEKFIKLDPSTGVNTIAWRKKCPVCGTIYETFSRTQKFCSAECSKKAQSKKLKYTKAYEADKAYIRLASRAHSIGVEVLSLLEHQGQIEHKCAICGSTEQLDCHHKNLHFLDNNPDNLQWLCQKCHHKVHSDIDKKNKEENKSGDEIYSDMNFTIYSHVLKK